MLDSVSADYFGTLRLAPAAGRLIDASDGAGAASADRVVILGHGFWQRHFGGDPAVIGRDIRIEDLPFRVIGVTPSSYFGCVWKCRPISRFPLRHFRRSSA